MFITYKHLQIFGNRTLTKILKVRKKERARERGREEQLKLRKHESSFNGPQTRSHKYTPKLPHTTLFNNYSSSDDLLLYFFHLSVTHLGHELPSQTKQKITSF